MKQTKWGTAVHEAGHAVIGRVLELPCGLATIVPNKEEGSAGHAITGDQWAILGHWEDERAKYHRDMPTVWRARMIAFMAGAEAERVVLGDSAGGDGEDQRQIAFMADNLMDTFSPEWDRWAARLRRQTVRLVRRHRRTIERVARALYRRRTLTAEQIDRLMRS
jgi:ATP-dependent Zn protease